MSSTDDVCFLHIIAVRLRANGYFYHFSLFVHGRKSIFLKNKRSSTGEQVFLLKTSVRPPSNKHFHQKQTFSACRTSTFIKNRRSAPAEQALLLKTNVQHLLNTRFYDLSSVAKVQRHVVYLRNNKPCPLAMRWHAPFSCPKYH